MKKHSDTLLGWAPLTVVWNLLLIYICFMICRVAFVWYNWEQFKGFLDFGLVRSMLRGSLMFDTAAIIYLTLAYMVLQLFPLHLKERRGYYKFLKFLLVLFVSVGLAMNLTDTVYSNYTGSRITKTLFAEFRNETNIISIFMQEALHSWYLLLLFVVMLFSLIKFIRIPEIPPHKSKLLYYTTSTIIFAAMLLLSVVGMRGGWTKSRPITVSNANKYVNRPIEAIAVLNTPFYFIRTLSKSTMEVPHYYDEETLDKLFPAVIYPTEGVEFKEKNVVVMILESFGTEYIGALNQDVSGYDGYTPFLDSLIANGMAYSNSFANGRKSIDAMPSILSSLPMLKEHFFLIPASLRPISGLAGELSKFKGYESAFYHGAENGSMGFEAFARSSGFERYSGMSEFCADKRFKGMERYDGNWAIWDDDFFQFFALSMGDLKQPFVSCLFTASSHHPYKLPAECETLYPEESLPIHKCIRYVDSSLRRFFETASRQPWYGNTIFVITADHTNLTEMEKYQTSIGLYRVPVIFYDPSGEMRRGMSSKPAQQIDIMPTILTYLGYDRPFVAFGKDLFQSGDSAAYAVNYNSAISCYQYMEGEYLLQFDGSVPRAVYNYVEDPLLMKNLLPDKTTLAGEYEVRLKAIIQQYMEHMNEKPMIYEE